MSTCTIPRATYSRFLTSAISRYISRGIPRHEAVARAHEIMRSAFTIAGEASPREVQLDADEEQTGALR